MLPCPCLLPIAPALCRKADLLGRAVAAGRSTQGVCQVKQGAASVKHTPGGWDTLLRRAGCNGTGQLWINGVRALWQAPASNQQAMRTGMALEKGRSHAEEQQQCFGECPASLQCMSPAGRCSQVLGTQQASSQHSVRQQPARARGGARVGVAACTRLCQSRGWGCPWRCVLRLTSSQGYLDPLRKWGKHPSFDKDGLSADQHHRHFPCRSCQ